jgi:hypothetical protein
MKIANLPYKKIIVAGAAATGGIYVLGKVAQYRGERIAAGESDPLAWSNNYPGGASIPVALAFTVGSGLLLKGQARQIGYAMAAGALIPAGQSLLASAQNQLEPSSDHYLQSGNRALAAAQSRYSASSRSLSNNSMADRALAS